MCRDDPGRGFASPVPVGYLWSMCRGRAGCPETRAAAAGAGPLAALATLVLAGAVPAEDRAPPCQSIDHPLAMLPELPVSRPGAAPILKHDKSYPAGEPAASRRGLDPPAATLFNVHSREALTIFPGNLPDGMVLAGFFRCRGFGDPGHLDPRLLEAALTAAADLGTDRVEVVSAYRSSKFNDMLSKKARRVAGESRHIKGQALDLRLAGIPARRLGAWFWEHFDGGVGTYPGDDFVHIDVGPKRRWRGR